jgi:ATPase family associated with various cellular activities (AAA)
MTRAQLAAPLARLRLQIEAAVLRRLNAGAGLGEPRPSSVYVREASALERLAGGTLRPQGSHRKAAAAVAAELAKARQAEADAEGGAAAVEPERDSGDSSASSNPRGSRLAQLARRFELDPTARELLLLAAAFELDPDSRDLLQALAGRRRGELTAELCADVLDEVPAHALLAQLAPGSPLRHSRLLAIDGDGLGCQLSIRSHALRWLEGDDGVPAALQQLVSLHRADEDPGVALPEATVAALDALAPMLAGPQQPPLVTLRGPRGSGRRAAAQRLARGRNQPLLAAAIPPLLAAEKQRRAPLLPDVLALATMLDAAVYLADIDALWDESGNADLDQVAALRRHRGVIAVGSAGRGGHVDVQRPAVVVAMTRAALGDRERSWRHALDRHVAMPGAPRLEPTEAAEPTADSRPMTEAETTELAAELGGRYVIGPGAIAEVVAEAWSYAAATAQPVSRDALEAAVGRRLSLRLGTFGSVVARKSRFSELILPDEVVDTLRDLLAMVRERSLILEKWGFQRHLGISRGVSALFSGEPGTGKTMAASVLASELGLELVRIDLSAVVSKFVGETEKNLARIFDEAQDAHAMLLFDEADSLFGKRTELKSAQDRFANLEVNYILQRMETFDGISVLTTNAENAIDPALQRRLNFRIRFPEPEAEERELLWRQLLPPAAGVGEVDFRALAERFEMTGGYIKNAVVRAAVIAARAGRTLTAEDLWSGAHHEYAEMGKVMPQLPMPGRRS